MGYRTLVVINHDQLHDIKEDPEFGKNLGKAICLRGNPNIRIPHVDRHDTCLGNQFHSRDTLLMFIDDGEITPLTIHEQILLQDTLRAFRGKK